MDITGSRPNTNTNTNSSPNPSFAPIPNLRPGPRPPFSLFDGLSDEDLRLAHLIFIDGIPPSQALVAVNPSYFSDSRLWHFKKNHAVRLVSKLRARARAAVASPSVSFSSQDLDEVIRRSLLALEDLTASSGRRHIPRP